MQTLRAEPTTINMVVCPPANSDHAPVFGPDLQPATVGAKNAGTLNPSIRLGNSALINSFGPAAFIRRSLTPNILNAIPCGHDYSRAMKLAKQIRFPYEIA